MSQPVSWPTDSHWCPRCEIHRTTTPTRLCPSCADDEKREQK